MANVEKQIPEASNTSQAIHDDNQFSAHTISLPHGGGAIRGIGEKFGVNPVTGTSSLSIPLVTSKARAGFEPQLTLSYDSGSGNGPFGFGWSLSLPMITRKTDKGLPIYADSMESDTFILSGAEDLVPIIEQTARVENDYEIQRYRPRIEGLFARIERWTERSSGAIHWRSITKDNITTLYGGSAQSRIADPADPTHVFSWLICESYNDKGGAIYYEYKAEDSAGVDVSAAHEHNRTDASRSTNRYLKRVHYGNQTPCQPGEDLTLRKDWLFEAVFDYGEHYNEGEAGQPTHIALSDAQRDWAQRLDPFSSYRAGFEVRTYRRCERFFMFHHFDAELGMADYPVRMTEFVYRGSAVASFIERVISSGLVWQPETGYLKKSLPPLELTYSQVVVDSTIRDIDPESLVNLPYGLDNSHYRWVDLRGEGISGILTEQGGRWYYKRNWSALAELKGETVRFGPVELIGQQPSSANLSQGRQQLLDLTGEGHLDLVQFSPPMAGYYKHNELDNWDSFRPFTYLPNLKWDDPNLRFVDLTGDGFADILITEDQAFCWYRSLAVDGFTEAERVYPPFDEEQGPRLVFADGTESIYLADMSGDGLADLVRIRNGEVCYWSNLGYGRFGSKVAMDNAPWFELYDLFHQDRLRLADIDGSGNTDIIYLSEDGVRLYFNQSGNGWSKALHLSSFPGIDTLATVDVADLFGTGTACLIWSSSLAGDAGRPMRYLDLMGSNKPHLLLGVRNHLGADTHIQYSTSTRFYLEDEQAGHPWINRLAFPVHVVERTETLDRLSGNRFVTRYTYHHGYFDGVEREFRGFGMVEQLDTEAFPALSLNDASESATNTDIASHVPPVLTRTWFHTGAYLEGERISWLMAHDYYGAPHDPDNGTQWQRFAATLLPDTILPDGLTFEEIREACRALKGSILRQEVYGLDGSEREAHPYSISERNYTVELLQARGEQRYAVFYVHPRETIDYHLERNPDDPRIAHQMVLGVDAYGNVERSVTIAYPRYEGLEQVPQQSETHLTFSLNRFANLDSAADWYRAGVPVEQRLYEVIRVREAAERYPYEDLVALFRRLVPFDQVEPAAVDTIPYEQWDWRIQPLDDRTQLRLIEHVRTIYRSDDLSAGLPLGEVESLALPYETYKLALTPALVEAVYGDRVDNEILTSAGYVYQEGQWWIPSGRIRFAPESDPPPQAELNEARAHFFLPRRFVDPFGNASTITYDRYDLLLAETRDALDNRTQAQNDYRVLQPCQVTDANGNRTQAAFDGLGMVAGTAVMGKPDEGLGDSLDNFRADLSQAEIDAFFADPRGDIALELLGSATTRIIYDITRYYRTETAPVFAAALARETHVHALAPGGISRFQVSISYSDGFGREIQKKVQAEPGPVETDGVEVNPRWVGSGWTIFNNKGNPVRQYEPFFTATHDYEFAVMVGVSPILFYDPVERVVATLHPNHTWEKVVFDPWQQTTWDVNDTVLLDPRTDPDVEGYFARLDAASYSPTWYMARQDGALGALERDSALKTAVHAATPTTAYFDTLGQTIVTDTHNRFVRDGETVDEHYATRVVMDIEGNQRAVIDALERVVMQYDYDLLSSRIYTSSMEAGTRRMLNDVTGKPVYAWDSRGHRLRSDYDVLRRPTDVRLSTDGGDEQVVMRMVYGESLPDAEAHNLRGKAYRIYDNAGSITTDEYDFKNNLLHSRRELARDYKTIPDWSTDVALEAQAYDSSTAYDALNRAVALTAPDGSIIHPMYNEANLLERVEAIVSGAEAASTFVADIDYNAKGQRELIVYGNDVATHYAYDRLTFRLTRLQTVRGNEPLQDLGYVYDPAGNITYLSDDAQQTTFFRNQRIEPNANYTYDAIYRLIAATGREHVGQMGEGGSLEPVPHSHDDAPRTGLLHPGDGSAMGRYIERYVYDAVGNLLQMQHRGSDPAHPGWTRRYSYEEASLLEPNSVSNRLSSTRIGDGDEEHYAYDIHGNMLTLPHLPQMQWDYLNRLVMSARQVTQSGTPETTYYVYDSGGQRVRKVTERYAPEGEIPTRAKERIYLSAGFEVYREYDGSGEAMTLERETLHMMDDKQRIALIETRTQGEDRGLAQLVRYQLGNHLGSAVLEVDASADIISYEEFYPYGSTSYQAVRNQTETPKRYRYTGKERDEESGLYYHGARYYAAWLGRWTACDPAGLVDGPNVYIYSRNRPNRLTDPTGTDSGDGQPQVSPQSSVFYGNDSSGNPVYVLGSGDASTQSQKTDDQIDEVIVHGPPRKLSQGKSPETASNDGKEEGVGEPGFAESLIPIWGSGRAAINHFQHGNYVRGTIYSVLAITDVFLVKSLVVAGGKVLAKGGAMLLAKEGAELVAKEGATVGEKALAKEGANEVVHLTTAAGKEGIEESGKVGGKWGVFALEADKVPSTALGKSAVSLVPKKLDAEIKIGGEALEAFSKPPLYGPFSSWRYFAGVRSSPLGSVNLATNRFIAGEIFKNGVFRQATLGEHAAQIGHQWLLDYGIDALIYTGVKTGMWSSDLSLDYNNNPQLWTAPLNK